MLPAPRQQHCGTNSRPREPPGNASLVEGPAAQHTGARRYTAPPPVVSPVGRPPAPAPAAQRLSTPPTPMLASILSSSGTRCGLVRAGGAAVSPLLSPSTDASAGGLRCRAPAGPPPPQPSSLCFRDGTPRLLPGRFGGSRTVRPTQAAPHGDDEASTNDGGHCEVQRAERSAGSSACAPSSGASPFSSRDAPAAAPARQAGATHLQPQPHPPAGAAPFTPRRLATMLDVLQRPLAALSASASASRCGAIDAFGRSLLAGSLSHTSRVSAPDCGTSQCSEHVGLLASHAPPDARLLDTAEVSGGRGGGLHMLLPYPPARASGGSLSHPISASDGAEGKSHTESSAGASDTLYLPQSDSERLLMLSWTCRRSAHSVSASRNASEMLPFIDPFAANDGMPSTCIRACPTRPRGRRARCSIAGSITSFGTVAGTMSSSDSVIRPGVSEPQNSDSARTRSSNFDTLVTRSDGASSATYMCSSSGAASTATMRTAGMVSTSESTLPAPPAASAVAAAVELHQTAESEYTGGCGSSSNGAAVAASASTLPVGAGRVAAVAHLRGVPADGDDAAPSGVVAASAVGTACVGQRSVDERRPLSPRDASACNGAATPAQGGLGLTRSGSRVARSVSPSVSAVATPPPTPATEEDTDADALPRAAIRWLEQQRPQQPYGNASVRSTSALSMRSSLLGRSGPGSAAGAAACRSGLAAQGYSGSQSPSFVDVPPLAFCSFAATWMRGWAEEAAVDAPLEVCGTTVSSLLRKADPPPSPPPPRVSASDDSVGACSELSRLFASGDPATAAAAAAVGGILLPHSSFCRSRPGPQLAKAERSSGSSLHRLPLPPTTPSAGVAGFSSNVAVRHTILVNSTTTARSVVESSAASVATTTTTTTTTAVSSVTRSTARVLVSQAGHSSAWGDEEEAAVVRDMMLGSVPPLPRDAAAETPTASEREMPPSRTRAMDAMLEHPDAPPFAKAARQRLHERRSHTLRRTRSRSLHSTPETAAAVVTPEAPVTVTAAVLARSCHSVSHSFRTQSRSSSAVVASAEWRCGEHDDADDDAGAVVDELAAAAVTHSSTSLVSQGHNACCQVARHTTQGALLALTAEFAKSKNPLQADAPLIRRALENGSDASAAASRAVHLTATEIHLPKVLPVTASHKRVSLMRFLGI
ncbi:hypothetical protein NESM_000056100 [Novymonas esmeraldas]|uniref:Uncharacterized protein n=1 Tax=Novymonas esmeraldas TaxID=1808958 RepID=A0AAW0F3R5_9TRYP